MMFRVFIVIIICSFIFNAQAQKSDSLELVPITTSALNKMNKDRLVTQLTITMKILEFKGDPRRIELINYPDSVYSILDTACIVLFNGGRWNPDTAPSTKGTIRRYLFSKKQDSVDVNTLKYLQFSSQYLTKGYPYYMIDSLYFRQKYTNSEGELLMTVDFINKPTSPDDRFDLHDRRVIYMKKE